MLIKLRLILITLIFSSSLCSAQFSITFPSERAIFQRNNQNQAVINIAGYFSNNFKKIEARLTPIVAGEGIPAPTDGGWSIIDSSPSYNNFYGSMTVTGGWYKLEVRGTDINNNTQIATLEKVGVGEVFLVAGQSNATGGDNNPNGPGAQYDQVNTVNFQNVNPVNNYIAPYNDITLPCPTYVHLDANSKTAPFGNYAWCWGAFGDQMYQKYKVPIMIFNAGWSSTSIDDWANTIDPNASSTSIFGQTFPTGLPFGHLKIALNNYINQLGIRAVLWHQGESDTKAQTTKEHYKTKLKSVIQASRDLTNKNNLAWVVSRASRFTVDNVSQTSAAVITAQNEIIDEDLDNPHVYPGPATDDYYDINYRHDQIHFRGDGVTQSSDGNIYSGLIHLAQFWTDKITPDFISSSIPYEAQAAPRIELTKNSSDLMKLSTSTQFNAYSFNWLNNFDCNSPLSTSLQWNTTQGIYGLKIVDAFGNVAYGPKVQITSSALPVELIYFTAKLTDGRPHFEWATTSESNSYRFEVERSSDAINFNQVSARLAAGNSSAFIKYTSHEEAIAPGQYYYRLKQVDLDGTFKFSQTVPLKVEQDELVSIYPNPISNYFNVESKYNLNEISIYDIKGKQMLKYNTTDKKHQVDTSFYPSGLYIINVNGIGYKIIKNQ